jgi:hypothetical protein
MMRHAALAAAALALSACGSVKDLFYAELEIPAVGITLPAQDFPGLEVADPGLACASDPSRCTVSTTLLYDLAEQVDLLDEPNAEYEIRLTDLALELVAGDAGADLRAIRSVSVEVFLPAAPPGSDPVVIASYLRPTGAAPAAIAVTGNSNVDLAPYLEAGKLNVRVRMAYDALTPAFTADVRGTFFVRVRLDYGRMI